MTDPLRRDPREFLRALKSMSNRTSWHKAMLFASRGRMVGYHLTLDHYNAVLFSQALWGRALELVQVIRAMQEDGVKPNGVSYYYICHGMANADHGMDMTGFEVNQELHRIQHWRVALNALQAADANGFDPNEIMFNATVAACSVPGIGKWDVAVRIMHELREREMKPHPEATRLLEHALIKAMRPAEATKLRNMAAELEVLGYEGKAEADPFAHIPNFGDDSKAAPIDDPAYAAEKRMLRPADPVRSEDSVFRPRVYRQLWWKWHAIANKYQPQARLKRRQITPPHSPTGIPGFYKL